MNTFLRFFYEFISVFFDGFLMIFRGLFDGIIKMFNVGEYTKVIDSYKGQFNGAEWLMVVVAVIFLLAVLALIGLLVFFIVKRFIRKAKNDLNKEELLEEIGLLNEQVRKLMKEKDELMVMKVSQLGLNPNEE